MPWSMYSGSHAIIRCPLRGFLTVIGYYCNTDLLAQGIRWKVKSRGDSAAEQVIELAGGREIFHGTIFGHTLLLVVVVVRDQRRTQTNKQNAVLYVPCMIGNRHVEEL